MPKRVRTSGGGGGAGGKAAAEAKPRRDKNDAGNESKSLANKEKSTNEKCQYLSIHPPHDAFSH
jgi:hypothetical protein